MLARHIEALKSTLFGLFYVMTEGVLWDNTPAMRRKTFFIMAIDYLQVQRILTAQRYGWTEATTNVVKNTDIVYLCTSLISQVIPRYSLFIVASLLVLGTLADTFYAAHLFKTGSIDRMWPLKLLRLLVATMVTTAFSSVIKWLLIPTDCLVSLERPTFSEEIDPGGDQCNPFAMPAILAVAPMILIALSYITFALVTSYLSFECNPLSRQPRASSTGRVEVLFAMVKVSGTILIYFADIVTSVAVTAVIFLGSCVVMRCHLQRLPWHDHRINMLRGAVLACVMWVSFSSLVVSVMEAADIFQEPFAQQQVQYALIGLIPVAFMLGIYMVHSKRDRIFDTINRLRGDWEGQQAALRAKEDAEMATSGLARSKSGYTQKSAATNVETVVPKKTMYTSFFDPTLDSKRAFRSGIEAHTAARMLLYHRKEDDLPFLRHVLMRGMEEHPDCPDLKLLRVAMERFVFKNNILAQEAEKAVKSHLNSLSIDFQYVVYVVDRKNTQASAQESIGIGNVTSMNLMEWGAGIERARKAHFQAVHKIRDFWRHLRKRSAHADTIANSDIADMIILLDEFETAMEAAKTEYESLLVNYSSSTELLQAYANFTDHVLNDSKTADKIRVQALTLENGERGGGSNDGEDDAAQVQLEQQCAASGTSSSQNDSARVKAAKWLESISCNILGPERKDILSLHRRVKALLLLLVMVAATGFVLIDQGLLTEQAMFRNIRLIDQTGFNRGYGFIASIELREQFLAARENKPDKFMAAQEYLYQVSKRLTDQHMINYEQLGSPELEDFYNNKVCNFFVPVGGKWENKSMNYWEYAIEYARYFARAGSTTMEEMTSLDMNIANISAEKANVAFVFENTHRNYIPTMEELLVKYEDNVESFGNLASQSVQVITAINGILSVLTSFFVIRNLPRSLKALQFRHLGCSFGMSLPRNVCQKLFKYYEDIELQMKILEDEELEQQNLLGMEDAASTHDSKNTHEEMSAKGNRSPMPKTSTQGKSSRDNSINKREGRGRAGRADDIEGGNDMPAIDDHNHVPLTLENVQMYTNANTKFSTDEMLRLHAVSSPDTKEAPFQQTKPAMSPLRGPLTSGKPEVQFPGDAEEVAGSEHEGHEDHSTLDDATDPNHVPSMSSGCSGGVAHEH